MGYQNVQPVLEELERGGLWQDMLVRAEQGGRSLIKQKGKEFIV